MIILLTDVLKMPVKMSVSCRQTDDVVCEGRGASLHRLIVWCIILTVQFLREC